MPLLTEKGKKPVKGVQHSQPHTFLEILLANLGLPEQMLLLSLQQDLQTIKRKCTFDYARNADCIKSTLKFNLKLLVYMELLHERGFSTRCFNETAIP